MAVTHTEGAQFNANIHAISSWVIFGVSTSVRERGLRYDTIKFMMSYLEKDRVIHVRWWVRTNTW